MNINSFMLGRVVAWGTYQNNAYYNMFIGNNLYSLFEGIVGDCKILGIKGNYVRVYVGKLDKLAKGVDTISFLAGLVTGTLDRYLHLKMHVPYPFLNHSAPEYCHSLIKLKFKPKVGNWLKHVWFKMFNRVEESDKYFILVTDASYLDVVSECV